MAYHNMSICDSIMQLAVFGTGAGGCATAAHLSILGHDVSIYDLPQFEKNIREIKKRNGIEIEGAIEGLAEVRGASTEIESVLKGAEAILVAVPAYGHDPMAKKIKSSLEDGQDVILTPGSTGGALEFSSILSKTRRMKKVRITETTSLPYAARLTGPAKVKISLITKRICFASFPAKETVDAKGLLAEIYKAHKLQPMTDVLETSLNNDNPVIHPAGVLLNAGRIEHFKGGFHFYQEGLTPSVINVIEAVDKERLALCERMGYKATPDPDLNYDSGYSPKRTYKEGYSAFVTSTTAPPSLATRYITEDVEYGLVTWVSLANMLNVKTPVMRSIIRLASALNKVDYWKQQKRSVKKLGISGLTVQELKRFLYEGKNDSEAC
jgi:opine dehydrogenase